MSKKGAVAVVGRVIVDRRYREAFYKSPLLAMEGYDLTGEEKQALAGMDRHDLEKLADSVGYRLRSWYINWAVHEE